ncbi:hypothetical protein GCM10020220_034140 [Nonomuraea rubra]
MNALGPPRRYEESTTVLDGHDAATYWTTTLEPATTSGPDPSIRVRGGASGVRSAGDDRQRTADEARVGRVAAQDVEDEHQRVGGRYAGQRHVRPHGLPRRADQHDAAAGRPADERLPPRLRHLPAVEDDGGGLVAVVGCSGTADCPTSA